MSATVKGLYGKSVCKLEGLTADNTGSDVKTQIVSATKFSRSSLKLCINRHSTKDDQPLSSYAWKSGDPIMVAMAWGDAGKSSKVQHVAPHQMEQTVAPHQMEQPPCRLLDQRAVQTEFCGCSKYGYVQIDDFAKKMILKKKTRTAPGPKYWVGLPGGTRVQSYPSPFNGATAEVTCSKLTTPPRCSSLSAAVICTPRSADSDDSTVASDSDRRRVHFSDGFVVGGNSTSDDVDPAENGQAALSEVVYIDRDICGFSLYEYAPDDDEFKEFASSRFARMFLQELHLLESYCQRRQQHMLACEMNRERHQEEERELDIALLQAGVKEKALQSTQ